MTCASCVARVEKALRKPPGVLEADVNLATEKATVVVPARPGRATRTWSPPSRRRLRRRRAGAGHGRGGHEAAADAEEAARAAAYRKLKRKVIVGFVLSVIIFVGTMQPDWFTFLPEWLHNGYLLWALASVVQFWVGGQFYTTAWSALKHGTTTMNTLVAMGSSAAYIYSVLGVLFPAFFEHQGLGEPMYFDSAAFIITLILLGQAARGARQGPDRRRHQGAHRPAAEDRARGARRRRDRRAGRRGAGRRPRRGAPRREGAGRRRGRGGLLGGRRVHAHRRAASPSTSTPATR